MTEGYKLMTLSRGKTEVGRNLSLTIFRNFGAVRVDGKTPSFREEIKTFLRRFKKQTIVDVEQRVG